MDPDLMLVASCCLAWGFLLVILFIMWSRVLSMVRHGQVRTRQQELVMHLLTLLGLVVFICSLIFTVSSEPNYSVLYRLLFTSAALVALVLVGMGVHFLIGISDTFGKSKSYKRLM